MSDLTLALIWLILAVVFGIAEALSVDLTAIWFSLGSIFSMLFAFMGVSVTFQIIIFFAVSVLALIFLKPFAKKCLHIKKTSTNADSNIGMVGKVTEGIDLISGKGRVFVNGLEWKASSIDASFIEEGESVIVKDIKGVTLEVERL